MGEYDNIEKNMAMVMIDGLDLKLIKVKDRTPEICLAAVKQNPLALKYIKHNQTLEICTIAVKKDPSLFRFAKVQSEELCIFAVTEGYDMLKYVKEQTPEICLAAVKKHGWSLKYVKEETPEICLAAVKSNGLALQFVYNQTPEICREAFENHEFIVQYAEAISPELFLDMVKNLGVKYVFRKMKYPTPEIYYAFIENYPDSSKANLLLKRFFTYANGDYRSKVAKVLREYKVAKSHIKRLLINYKM